MQEYRSTSFNAGANGLCVYADTSRPEDGTRALCRLSWESP